MTELHHVVMHEIADKAIQYKTLKTELESVRSNEAQYRDDLNHEYQTALAGFTTALHTYPAIHAQWHTSMEPIRKCLPMPIIMPNFSLATDNGKGMTLHDNDNVAFNRHLYTQLLWLDEFRFETDPKRCMYLSRFS